MFGRLAPPFSRSRWFRFAEHLRVSGHPPRLKSPPWFGSVTQAQSISSLYREIVFATALNFFSVAHVSGLAEVYDEAGCLLWCLLCDNRRAGGKVIYRSILRSHARSGKTNEFEAVYDAGSDLAGAAAFATPLSFKHNLLTFVYRCLF